MSVNINSMLLNNTNPNNLLQKNNLQNSDINLSKNSFLDIFFGISSLREKNILVENVINPAEENREQKENKDLTDIDYENLLHFIFQNPQNSQNIKNIQEINTQNLETVKTTSSIELNESNIIEKSKEGEILPLLNNMDTNKNNDLQSSDYSKLSYNDFNNNLEKKLNVLKNPILMENESLNSVESKKINNLNTIKKDSIPKEILIKDISKNEKEFKNLYNLASKHVQDVKSLFNDKDNRIIKISDDSSQINTSVLTQVKDKIITMVKDQTQHVTMELFPENLGKINVKMVFEKEQLRIEIIPSNEKAGSILMANVKDLNGILEQNLNNTHVDINLNLNNFNQLEQNSLNYKNQQNQQHNNKSSGIKLSKKDDSVENVTERLNNSNNYNRLNKVV